MNSKRILTVTVTAQVEVEGDNIIGDVVDRALIQHLAADIQSGEGRLYSFVRDFGNFKRVVRVVKTATNAYFTEADGSPAVMESAGCRAARS